jgi:hypothetical protein
MNVTQLPERKNLNVQDSLESRTEEGKLIRQLMLQQTIEISL